MVLPLLRHAAITRTSSLLRARLLAPTSGFHTRYACSVHASSLSSLRVRFHFLFRQSSIDFFEIPIAYCIVMFESLILGKNDFMDTKNANLFFVGTNQLTGCQVSGKKWKMGFPLFPMLNRLELVNNLFLWNELSGSLLRCLVVPSPLLFPPCGKHSEAL